MWGPLSDKFGRFPVLISCLIVYEAFTIGCIFTPTIGSLIALRAIQGFISAATLVLVQAIIADVFPPIERGSAMGAFLGPMLIGPILAPLIGGILTQTFSWRCSAIYRFYDYVSF